MTRIFSSFVAIVAIGIVSCGRSEKGSISTLERELQSAKTELAGLSRLSLYGGVGPIGYRTRRFEAQVGAFWVKIDLDGNKPIDQVVVVPTLSRTIDQGIHADALPEEFSIVVGLEGETEGRVVAEYCVAESGDPGIAPLVFSFPEAEAGWVRMDVPRLARKSTGGKYSFQLAELFVFSGSKNVALRQSVSASLEMGVDSSPAWADKFLVDGVTPYLMDTKWGAGELAYVSMRGETPDLTIDFGDSREFSEIRLHAIDQSDTVPQSFAGDLGIPRHLRIEGAEQRDFSDSRVLLDVRLESIFETGPIMSWNIEETSCRFVRLSEIDPRVSADLTSLERRLGFAEWELISDGENVASGASVTANGEEPMGIRLPRFLTDGRNQQGRILPLREWVNELARRHFLEFEISRLSEVLNGLYRKQDMRLTWMTRLAVTLAVCIAFVFYFSRVQRDRHEAKVRERIAANLHDELGANLHAIGLLGDIAEESVRSPDRLIETVRRIRGLTERTGAAAKTCTNMLEAKGICEVLSKEMKGDAQRLLADLDFEILIEGEDLLNALRRRQRIDLFLFYKESLTNIIRHARASVVRIHVTALPGKVTLSVSDNGCGFTGGVPSSLLRRARLMGGRPKVEHLQEGGTLILLELKTQRFKLLT